MPTTDHNEERHPSFGMARFNTVSSSPGASLFDSEIRHNHYVILEVEGAYRYRDINRDWIHGNGETVVEVAMSMAQFGALVSSFGSSGVPVTITRNHGAMVENPPYEPRMAQSTREVEETTERLFAKVADATKELREAFNGKAGRRDMEERLRSLEIELSNAVPNARYAAETFTEHVENVVTKARYDIEAAVQAAGERGLDAGPAVAGMLPAGEDA